jgi:transglutaminase-like putative cysteine protease
MKAQLYDLTHTTTYDYPSPVTVSHHLLRVSPRRLARQFRLTHTVETEPAAAATSQRTDYFGNDVTFATIEGAHRRLRVTSRSRVAVGPAFIPEPSETPPWEAVRGLCRSDRSSAVLEATEFTFATPTVPMEPAFADYALASFTPRCSILEAALDLTARIHADFTFDATATTVSTPLLDVLQKRRGVCQDFAHFEIACLRSLGLPARYVSGYLETIPPPGQPRLVGADASHAWVSIFCPGIGWIDLDPTNNCLPSIRHITAAWGRDYGDVSPIRGVLLGNGEHALSVAVDVLPLGAVQLQPDSSD